MKDGLPSNFIYRSIQDYKGNLWICSPKGISKFDGYEFRNFTVKDGLPTNDVFNLIEDFQHRIWLMNDENKLCYIKNDKIKVFDFETSNRISISSIEHDYVDIYNYNQLIRIYENDSIVPLDVNKVIQVDTVETHRTRASTYLSTHHVRFKELCNFKQWLITPNSGGRVDSPYFSKETGCISYLASSINNKIINHFVVLHNDIQKNQLQHSSYNELTIFDSHLNVKKEISLPYDSLVTTNSIFQDQQDNLWIAKADGLHFIHHSLINGSILQDASNYNEEITNVLKYRNGVLYLNTKNAIFWTDKKNTREIHQLPIEDRIRPISDVNIKDEIIYASIYSSSIHQLSPIDDWNFALTDIQNRRLVDTTTQKSINTGITKKFAPIDSVNWLISSRTGLYTTNFKQPYYERISSIFFHNFEIKDGLIILINNEQLFSYKNDSIYPIHPTIQNPYKTQIIDSSHFIVFTEQEKSYLANESTYEEITEFRDLYMLKTIIEKDTIWFLHTEGIIKALYDNQHSDIEILEKYNLKLALRVNQIFDFLKNENEFTLATNNGIYYMDINHWQSWNETIPFHIDSIKTSKTNFVQPTSLRLPYDERNIEISFKAIYLNKTENPIYHYRLKNIEHEFIETKSLQIRYPDLKPGKYTFEVFAVNSNQTRSKTKTVEIIIAKAWWQTYWFLFICCLIFLATIIGLFKRRERVLSEKSSMAQQFAELELNALQSQMNPHFVFNAMGSLQNLVQQNQSELADQYIAKFARLMRMFLDASKHKFISINQELNIVKSYFELEKLRFKDKINLEIKNDLDLLELQQSIPASLIQPFIENAINHGLFHKEEGGLVILKLYAENETIFIEIIDDGIGRKKAKEYKKNKTTQHESRALDIISEKINALVKIENLEIDYKIHDMEKDNIALGTKVIIEIKNSL